MLIYAIVLIVMMLFNWAPKAIECEREYIWQNSNRKKQQRRKHKMALLEVKNLGISFGGLRAVDGFQYAD